MGDETPHTPDQVTLQVKLELAGETATVMCCLQAMHGRQSTEVGLWTITAQEFGLPSRLTEEATRGFTQVFRQPTTLIAGVKDAFQHFSEFSGPLWIQLVKPYGYLGLAPWEAWLAPALNRPVLRLPEIQTSRPREAPGSLDMVICASAALADGPFQLENYLPLVVERVVAAVSHRHCRFHVFTDYAVTDRLRHIWRQNGRLDQSVHVYPPDQAIAYAVPQRTGKISTSVIDAIDNPWLLWIRDALQGQSVDVVHFVCHGYCAADQAALAFAESPLLNNDPLWSRFVSVDELKTFLVQVGAWAVAVTSPENNYSDLGLRAVADALTQGGQGVVLYHDWRNDHDAAQLAAVYGCIFHPTPLPPPPTPALAVACQPFHIAEAHTSNEGYESRAPRALESSRPASQLNAIFQGNDNVPSWLASSARYVEQCRWDLSRTTTESDKPKVSRQAAERAVGVNRALEQIERAMARVALRKKGK